MGLETFTNIASLNELWPLGSDVKAEGDDHIRGIKKVLKNEFPQGGKTAETRSRVVNGAMQISQENGNTAGTTDGYYPADQWQMYRTMGGTMTAQRVQVVTPNGSRNRFRITVTVADASLAAADYLEFYQPIEGTRISDFGWGAAGARQVVLRFGFKGPAGTYSISIANGAFARTYVANFTIAAGQANTDTTQTFVIPGDAAGTWLVDTQLGMIVAIVLATGSTGVGVAGWQAGAKSGTASNTNGMATAGAVYELFDVGFYLDPLATGLPPPWQMPDEAQELEACQRYLQKYTPMTPSGVATAAAQTLFFSYPIITMRTAVPAITASNISNSNTTGYANSGTSASLIRLSMASTAAGIFYSQSDLVVSARM